MGEKKVYVGDSFSNLRKSMNQLQNQQSGGSAPRLYPSANTTPATPAPAPLNQSSSGSSGSKPKT